MIKIEYDATNNQAIIGADGSTDPVKWVKIRRIVEDSSPISSYSSSDEISVPWWCFLNIRNELVRAFRIDSVTPRLSSTIKSLLQSARQHEADYLAGHNSATLSLDEIKHKLVEKGFQRNLTIHQMRNVQKLLRYPAAATFSVPGAGKTSEALAYFYLKRRNADKLIAVAPRNAFASWEEEIVNCIPESPPSVVRLQGSDRIERLMEQNYTIFLITYQQFYRVEKIVANYMRKYSCFMFLDESHRIKRGHSGVHGSSILSVCHLPRFKLIMSGTPLPNAIDDLVPQFTYLYPEIYVDPYSVSDRIRPIFVRTKKNELGLKPPIRRRWAFHMKPAQRRLYENIISETRRRIEGLRLSDRMLLHEISKCVVRLIQVTTDPALLINTELGTNPLLEEAVAEGPGIKVEEACHLARNLAYNGEKSIIWTIFVNTVENVADLLSDLNAQYIYGGTPTDEDEENFDSRESIIRRFHDDPSIKVLVANPAACAEGISLHKVCHNAIYIDRSYNAAHYLQSEDRIHRLGLKPDDDTFIHVLTCNDSIDASIGERLELKASRMGGVLNDDQLNIEPIEMLDEESGLTFEDIKNVRKLILGGTHA